MPLEKVGVRAVVEGVGGYVRDANRIDRSTAGMGRGVQGVASKFNVSTTQALRFGAALVGVQLGISVMSRTIVGLQDSTVGAAIAFESSFAGIRKTMSLTEAEFERLARANRDLATEIPVTVNELNRIGELAGQLGVRGVANVIEFEETIAKLAVTTNLSAESAAIALAQFANILQIPQDQVDNLGSAIVGLGNNFATVESKIVDFGQRIAGAGKIAGLTAGDVFGIGTAFASVGVEAERGGTAIQQSLIAMQKAVIEGGQELELFAAVAGTTTEEFADLFREDAAEAFTLFVEGLGTVGEQGFKVLDALGLAGQRLIGSFLSVAGAGDTLRRAIKQGNEEFEKNIALNKEAEQRFATTDSKLQLLRNAFADIGIAAGDATLEGLIPLIDAMLEWIDTNGDEFAEDLQTAITGVTNTVRGLIDAMQALAALGPVSVIIETAKGTVELLADFLGFITGAAGVEGTAREQRILALLGEQARVRQQLLDIQDRTFLGVPGARPIFLPEGAEIERIGLEAILRDIEDELAVLLPKEAARAVPSTLADIQRIRGFLAELQTLRAQTVEALEFIRFEQAEDAVQEFEDRLDSIDRAIDLRTAQLEGLIAGAARIERPEAEEEEERFIPERLFIDPDAARKAAERLAREIERARQQARRNAIAQSGLLGDLIITALKRRAQQELDVTLATIDDERDARDSAHKARLEQIDDERDAKIEALRDETAATVAALNAEIDALDEEATADQLARLERDRALAFEEQDVFEADQALRAFQRRQRRDALREEIGDVQSFARDRERELRAQADTATEIARDEFEAAQRLFDEREVAARETFEQITEDWRLQSEARRLILTESQGEIVALLNAFAPAWRTAGQSLGEQLVDGIEAGGIVEFLDGLLARIGALQTAATVFDGFLPARPGDPGQRQVATTFQHGGTVSPGGGRVPILVEPGELVLNPAQQAALFGGGGAGGTVFERGAFDGMFRGATLTGSVDENRRMVRSAIEDVIDDQLGHGALVAGVNLERR